jgi:hypothetical protein
MVPVTTCGGFPGIDKKASRDNFSQPMFCHGTTDFPLARFYFHLIGLTARLNCNPCPPPCQGGYLGVMFQLADEFIRKKLRETFSMRATSHNVEIAWRASNIKTQ